MNQKFILVVGCESTCSWFVTNTIFTAITNRKKYRVEATKDIYLRHISLPRFTQAKFSDVKGILKEQRNKNKEVYVVITTRYIPISEKSRVERFKLRTKKNVKIHTYKAKQIIDNIITDKNINSFVWSFETFLFLKNTYLQMLYNFLNIKSNFMPNLKDCNLKYLKD